jgi:multidrug transporter EmrE-like cation transporter
LRRLLGGRLLFCLLLCRGLLPALLTRGSLFISDLRLSLRLAILHIGYYVGLTEAYRAGDMGQVYPLARGSAPLMTAVATAAVLGETLAAQGYAGIALLAGGVFLLSFRGGREGAKIEPRAVGFALFTACTICG